MKFLLTFLALFILTLGFGQNVRLSGTCVGKKNIPIQGVSIQLVTPNKVLNQVTDSLGFYSFIVQKGDSVQLSFVYDDLREVRNLFIQQNEDVRVPAIYFPVLPQKEITFLQSKVDPFTIEKMPLIDFQKLSGGVERALVLTTAATSNNELTSNYNVRGGNYDENLVYVNGFLVYRPFLTRSGQQEGMSFIHSSLVESVRFSAGGFDAQYGDRLSSVLDITYNTPKKFGASGLASLLGAEAHVEQEISHRFNYLVGARYRSNGYLLNSLPTKGSYNPVFADAQMLMNYNLNEKLTLSFLGHYSSNDFRFSPETSETDFGTANEAYSFRIYFDGQEKTRFQTMMGGLALKWQPSKRTKLDFYASAFNSDEREYFDIQGQYYINELETDPSKEEYGDSIAVLGVGTFLNHARNRLNATIFSVYHNGEHQLFSNFTNASNKTFKVSTLKWGVQFQQDHFTDVLSEWKMIDSAGYSLPQASPNQVELFETIKGNLTLSTFRISGFTQWNTSWSNLKKDFKVVLSKKIKKGDSKETKTYEAIIPESSSKFALALGIRGGYTQINNEPYITPRVSLTYFPRSYMVKEGRVVRRSMSYRFSSGLYYQPPFYREFRTFDGQLRTNVKSQKSLHIVAGTDYYFNMWGREKPFKLTGELFYKYLWDVNPYEIDNVRTRYFAENNAVAYAYGVDMNIYGEFVKGIESFFKLGILSTYEDLKNDSYKEYYNAAGEKIIFGYSEDQEVVDSATIYPGFIPRPTDQIFTFGALVQDQMPGLENFTVQMGLQFGSPLPYGPPDHDRYKDVLRMKSYFRVDLGLSYDFMKTKKQKATFWTKNFTDAIISLEVFNLLGIKNVLSKQWIQDVEGRYYSIPNYLTARRFNLKLIVRL
jgi:hypothetical protein